MTEAEVIVRLLSEIKRAGTQKAFAQANNLSEQFVSDVVLGRRPISSAIEKALGLFRVTYWTPSAPNQGQSEATQPGASATPGAVNKTPNSTDPSKKGGEG